MSKLLGLTTMYANRKPSLPGARRPGRRLGLAVVVAGCALTAVVAGSTPGWAQDAAVAEAVMRLKRLERQEPWADEPYPYIVLDQDLQDVLREFGSNVGVPVKVSGRVEGKVRGRWPSLTPGQFLDRLATAYGLQWYYDGQTLHVTTTEEAVSEMLPLGPVRFYELYRELRNLKIADPRFPIRAASQANVALVSGPPRFVAAVRETLGALQQAYRFETTIVRGRTQERPTL